MVKQEACHGGLIAKKGAVTLDSVINLRPVTVVVADGCLNSGEGQLKAISYKLGLPGIELQLPDHRPNGYAIR